MIAVSDAEYFQAIRWIAVINLDDICYLLVWENGFESADQLWDSDYAAMDTLNS